MLNAIIDFSLRNRLLVIVAALGGAGLGAFALRHLDIDAFPDTTPVQVQVNAYAPALNTEEIELQITVPVEQALAGMPHLIQVRSVSRFGISQVVVTFADGTDIYFARQQVNERLQRVPMPPHVERPQMGPVSTGLGEIFHYVVRSSSGDITEARTIQDWMIKPKLRTVQGVAEVNGWGGFEKQYQIRVDPQKLVKHHVTFTQVMDAVAASNRNVGGGFVRRSSEMIPVHGLGRTVTVEEIKAVVISAPRGGVPIRVRDVAEVQIGHEIRRGAVTMDGKGEVVLGLGFLLMGENSHEVASALDRKLKEIKPTLPAGTDVQVVYNRTHVVDEVIATVRKNLLEAGLLVIAVLFLFLGNLRAALIVALAIPLSLLFAFCGMLRFGIAASLLSLGAIDFGMVVDSSVVMVENCVRHIAHGDLTRKSKMEMVRDAAVEVRKPTLFGELIIMIVYLPILTLEGIEGKMYRPMALTVIFALAGSMVLSLTLMPVLASLLLPRRITEREPLLMRLARICYAPLLRFTLHHKAAVLLIAVSVLAFAFGVVAPRLGSEFVPQMSEGSIAIAITRLAGTSLEDVVERNTRIEKGLKEQFPDEIEHVWSRAGTAEVATDPMGIEMTDMYVTLKPRDQWHKAATQKELTDQIEEFLRDVPGHRIGYTQPIKMRLEEMISGAKGDVVVKLFGDDLEVLKNKAEEIQKVLQQIDGARDVGFEQVTGQSVLQVKLDQDKLARYGVSQKTVLDQVQALGGLPVGEVLQGMYRFPIAVRLPEQLRRDTEELKQLLVTTPGGEQIPLERLAEVKVVEDRPSTLEREWGQRVINITMNVRGRDQGSFVEEAKRTVAEKVALPANGRYHIEWGGKYEHLISAQQRLYLVIPVALLLIFFLLYMTYGSLVDTLRVFTGIPFAAVGGIFALWLRDMPFSISAAIGFIAMSGVAVLDDMILVSTIRQYRDQGMPLEDAVTQASITRLRPVLMTTLVASLGFLPMAFSTGMGSEVQRPLATVVIGGVISAMVMSLLVVRVLYVVFQAPARLEKKLEEELTQQTG